MFAAGTVFSLLGPNGAGKTTTVNVLTTLMKADGGTVRVAGHDVATEAKAVRAAIGVTGQFAAVDELLTGQENLQLMVDLKRLGSGEGKRVVTGAAGAVRPDGVGAEAGVDLLRGYAPEAGSGDDAGRQAAGSSSWTSRRRDWIRAAAARCGTSSASWWPTA